MRSRNCVNLSLSLLLPGPPAHWDLRDQPWKAHFLTCPRWLTLFLKQIEKITLVHFLNQVCPNKLQGTSQIAPTKISEFLILLEMGH